jgi:chemotaxis protein MotB
MKKTTLLVLVIVLFSSCVSTRKYNKTLQESEDCNQKLSETLLKQTELSAKVSSLEEELNIKDSLLNQKLKLNERLASELENVNNQNEELNKQLATSNSKVNEILKDKGSNLQQLNNELNKKELELNQKEKNLDSLKVEFIENQNQMKKLKQELSLKDKQLKQVQTKLKDALLGFKDKGLSIETKNGKVYVSMEEKLLFSSGSWQVSKDGMKALQEIAVVLSNNPDIDIMVEGHTDNVPLMGKNQIKDNWDLSVMRATSITKILLDNTGISPKRIVPCGRSEYMPVNDNKTPEHRAKNRRTEIILSPKVNELINIIK